MQGAHMRLLVVGCLTTAALGNPVNPSCEVSAANIGLSAGSQLFFPDDPAWDNETIRWTVYQPPTFSAAARPALESDVQALVKFATRCNLAFLATSGRHGFSTTLAELQGGLDIDLSAFRDVSVNADHNTLTVGGGVRFLDVLDPVYDAGKEISVGSGACVGMVSPTTGGGVGRLSGTHGIISDQLLSVRMVVADGRLVTASAHENPDLFWAVRGAGGNFGVVVEAVYQVTDLESPNVINLDYAFTSNATGAVIDFLSSFGKQTPAKLSFIVEALYNEELFGGFALTVNGIYTGSKSEAEAFVAPLLDKVTPFRQNVSSVPANQLVYAANFGSQGDPTIACSGKGVHREVFGAGINTYDKETFVSFIEAYEELITNNADLRGSIFFIEQFSIIKVLEIPDASSSYPWRDITSHLLFNYAWSDPENEEIADAFGKKWRDALQATAGFDPPQTYVNYGHGDEDNDTLYSKRKLPQLQALKKHWDPDNVFRFHHAITTEGKNNVT